MARTVQIRDVPDDVHRVLRIRAAEAGLSLSEYLRREITDISRRPSVAGFLAQAASAATSRVPTDDVVAAVRADRDSR